MYDYMKEFIKPEFLILVPVLYVLGMSLKKSKLQDHLIPLILGVVSVALVILYFVASSCVDIWQSFLLAVFSGLTQGILCDGASVYVNQLIRQRQKKNDSEKS